MLEYRKTRPYFYRYREREGRTQRIYVGSGDVALQAALADERRRAEEAARAAALKAERERLRAADAPAAQLMDAAETLTRACLLLSGFHQNNRQSTWRKRRAPRKTCD